MRETTLFTCSELRMEADVSALSYEGFSWPASLISSPLLPQISALAWQAFSKPCRKFSVKNDQQEEIKEKKKSQKRGEKTAWGEQIHLTWRLSWPEFKQAKHTWIVKKAQKDLSLHMDYPAAIYSSLMLYVECLFRRAHWEWIRWSCLKDHWTKREETHWLINA